MITKSKLTGMADFFGMRPGDKNATGNVVLSCYQYDNNKDPLYNLRAIRDGVPFMQMVDGIYVRMTIDGELFMSDTNMEKLTNEEFVFAANGKVLIAGLGIGLVLRNLEPMVNSGKITEITVVEKSESVINAISPFFKDMKWLNIVCADINEWTPSKNALYDTIYFDIWPDISTDNIHESNALHRRYRKYLNKKNPLHFMNSWMLGYLRRQRKQELSGCY